MKEEISEDIIETKEKKEILDQPTKIRCTSKENSDSKIVKNILNTNDFKKYIKDGLWTCHICSDKKYLFVFELFQHWRESHGKDFQVGTNTKLEDKLFEICEKKSLLRR